MLNQLINAFTLLCSARYTSLHAEGYDAGNPFNLKSPQYSNRM